MCKKKLNERNKKKPAKKKIKSINEFRNWSLKLILLQFLRTQAIKEHTQIIRVGIDEFLDVNRKPTNQHAPGELIKCK
jgi:hypothetical protein